MLRKRENCVIVTFPSTAAALAAEMRLQAEGLPGRLIPTPREITAGCGLAWRAPAHVADDLRALFVRAQLDYEIIRQLII